MKDEPEAPVPKKGIGAWKFYAARTGPLKCGRCGEGNTTYTETVNIGCGSTLLVSIHCGYCDNVLLLIHGSPEDG